MKPLLVVLSLAGVLKAEAPAAKCVQVYYDSAPQVAPRYAFGRVHALQLQNLLGHFPALQQRVIPIEKYEAGQLGRCAASFYLGTYFDNALPPSFLADFTATTRTVVWAGYNIWKLPAADLEKLWGARYRELTKLDTTRVDELGRPTFFKLFDYQGETFEKYGEFDALDLSRFNAAYELTALDLLTPEAEKGVLSWARHNGRLDQRLPYVLKKQNHWFVADTPFSYITEEDRYLIFADLLFDVLQENPRRSADAKKPAHFRVEDVHAMMPAWQLYGMLDLFTRADIPFGVAVIPLWVDALDVMKRRRRYLPAASSPGFMEYLRAASLLKASYILHGVTHQYATQRNPFTGISGDDFEFWDRVKNRPVDRDSERFVVDRIADGLELLASAGVRPAAWMAPHYQASPLDYRLFGRLFAWNIGRVIYFPPGEIPDGMLPTGQFFPYEVYGDVYGQRLIPENIGNVQPFMNEQVHKTMTINDMIRIMKRNSRLRDAWASFFVHPSMLDGTDKGGTAAVPGDSRELERLIQAAKDLGYEFIGLNDWTRAPLLAIRPEPIEVLP